MNVRSVTERVRFVHERPSLKNTCRLKSLKRDRLREYFPNARNDFGSFFFEGSGLNEIFGVPRKYEKKLPKFDVSDV